MRKLMDKVINTDAVFIRTVAGCTVDYMLRDFGQTAVRVTGVVPPGDMLTSFVCRPVKGADDHERYMVLDPYGDEFPEDLRQHTDWDPRAVLVVGLHDGCLYCGHVRVVGKHVVLTLMSMSGTGKNYGVVPKNYLDHLPDIMHEKRPYNLHVRTDVAEQIMTRWLGFSEVRDNLVICLQFSDGVLEICGESYRWVHYWQR